MRRGGIGFFQVSRAIPADGEEPIRKRDLPLPTPPPKALAESLRHGLGHALPRESGQPLRQQGAPSFLMVSAIGRVHLIKNHLLPW